MKLFNEALLRLMAGVQGLGAKGAEERGQTLAEYGLLLRVMAVAIITTAFIAFRGAIAATFDAVADCLNGL